MIPFKFKSLLLVVFLIGTVSSSAKRIDDSDAKAFGFEQKQEFPFDKSKQDIPPYVQEKRFKLDIRSEDVTRIRKKLEKHSEIMEGTLDISILQKPLTKILKTVDTLYLHPSFISTIMLPKQLKIINALPSFETTIFDYNNNILRLQPTRNAKTGNISMSLSDGQKNYTMNIFVKKYFANDKCVNNGQNYVCSDDFLSTIVKYIPPRSLDTNSKLKIVEEYLRVTNKTKISIPRNLDYVMLRKGKETFYIIRDDEFGSIFRNGTAFSVRNAIN
ncbi:hypothetical protein [Poseidonibacter ostreae]|uniref:AMIN domain-containing protein n=1 Tax=Poseidonibacter ostreae TaxID=2654171 RepID=A0A6L4WWS7_9BACT|nr:hypothetical protein [Poseidonibacter ostreae]KAB7891309.1 hypothetical protein GBG19_00300 [Poseidonibacter ostreae]